MENETSYTPSLSAQPREEEDRKSDFFQGQNLWTGTGSTPCPELTIQTLDL